MTNFKRSPNIQGKDSILIDAPASAIWPLIHDSMQMVHWGPPVEKVEVILETDQHREEVGSKRIVHAVFSPKRSGWYKEIRTEQLEGQKVTFLIYEDSFGMGKMLTDVGASMELFSLNEAQTEFVFTFYHRPKNLLGWLMNPIIKADQKKNRRKALQSIKQYVETGIAIKNV